ncbi:hypothetical protein Gotri_028105 [Gossypium trilobum]|uniref:Uncharacterized protein n=1 Tax=Gossypium trilobum TaxID=34281 RepID=A0A7J9FVG4_9ROSI|nr:hypothetical protein [Gossypium trilobum]
MTLERWMAILQNLQDEYVKWKSPWMVPDEILSRQFIPVTQGLAQCEFSYKGDNYKKMIQEMCNAWKQIHQMKRFFVGPMTTPEYYGWWSKRKLETEKLSKGMIKAKEDLDSLKIDYKRLRLSMRTSGLRKTSEHWRQEIREKKIKADRWERKFQEAQMRNEALEKILLESWNEKGELKARVAELEKFFIIIEIIILRLS